MVNRQNKMGITRLEPDTFTRLICINSSHQESVLKSIKSSAENASVSN